MTPKQLGKKLKQLEMPCTSMRKISNLSRPAKIRDEIKGVTGADIGFRSCLKTQ